MGRILLGQTGSLGVRGEWLREVRPRAAFGPMAYIVLTVLVLQHPALSNHSIPVTDDVFFGLSLVGVFNVLTFFLLAFLFAWKRIVLRGARYQRVLACALAVGVIGNYALEVGGMASAPFSVVMDVLCGSSLACIGVDQVRCFAALPSRQGAVNLLVALIGAAALLLLANTLNAPLIMVLCLGLVTLSYWSIGPRERKSPNGDASSCESRIHIPVKLMVTIAVQGLSTGLIQGAFVAKGESAFFLVEGAAFLGASVLAVVFFWHLRRDFNHLLYVIAFPIMAFGHLGIAVAGEVLPVLLIHETGYRFIMFLSWMLAVWVIRHKGLSASWVWPCIMCSFVGGRVFGVMLSTVEGSFVGLASVEIEQMVMVFVVLFCALLLFGSARLGDGWGMVSMASDGEDTRVGSMESAALLVAQEYGLTPREVEVFLLLARGRDQAFIAERLHISVDTVKTHRRSIYRKAGIHSHQDLLSLLEDAQDAFRDESDVADGPMASQLLGSDR